MGKSPPTQVTPVESGRRLIADYRPQCKLQDLELLLQRENVSRSRSWMWLNLYKKV